MNTADLERMIKGLPPVPKCNDFASLGIVKAKEYSCPNCGEMNDDEDGYEINGETYPKWFNESKGSTLDGNYWDWDEVHCCKKCKTKYWFRNGAY